MSQDFYAELREDFDLAFEQSAAKLFGPVEEQLAEVDAKLDEVQAQAVMSREIRPRHTETPLTVVVSGCRDLTPLQEERLPAELFKRLDAYNVRPHILVGDARGVDRLVTKAIDDWPIYLGLQTPDAPSYTTYEVVKAVWEDAQGRFRKQGGMERNEVMLKQADRLIAFWDGESAGTGQAIEFARQIGVKTFVVRIDEWETEAAAELNSQITGKRATRPSQPKAPVEMDRPKISVAQIRNANDYQCRYHLMNANHPIGEYIGRGKRNTDLLESPLHNPFKVWEPPYNKVPGATLPDYRKHLWTEIMNRNVDILLSLHRLTPETTLWCHCSDVHTCHGSVVVAAYNFLFSKAGRQYRLTESEVAALTVSADEFAKMDHRQREDVLRKTHRSHSSYWALVTQNRAASMPGRRIWSEAKREWVPVETAKAKVYDERITRGRPYVAGQKVFFVNGDVETPAKIVSVEYGRNWTDDPDTGIRRFEIINCVLENAATGQTWVYSDHHRDVTMDRRRDELWPTVTAPYIMNKRAAREITPGELKHRAPIQVGRVVRLSDRVTGEAEDVGTVIEVETCAWYKLSPGQPVQLDAWQIKYRSLLDGTEKVWTADDGRRADLVN